LPRETPEETLRSLADRRGFRIGVAAGAQLLKTDLRYAGLVARQFNALTPENGMKWEALQPRRDRFTFDSADSIVEFAENRDMDLRGHPLVWHRQLPAWLTRRQWSREELIDILRNHIVTVAGRYRGRVWAWDVVNEAVDDSGGLRSNIWCSGIGPEYISMAFKWAHQADPGALLFYNDYGAEGLGAKSGAVYRLLVGLVRQGVPVHGVGLQMHLALNDHPPPAEIAANIDRLGSLGLRVHISEMDVRLRLPATWDRQIRQARLYGDILEVCRDADACEALVLWGVTDRFSWVPHFFPGMGDALIFDRAYQPKPAYWALYEALVR
jgi:endo-1,4-beta-xylanase